MLKNVLKNYFFSKTSLALERSAPHDTKLFCPAFPTVAEENQENRSEGEEDKEINSTSVMLAWVLFRAESNMRCKYIYGT